MTKKLYFILVPISLIIIGLFILILAFLFGSEFVYIKVIFQDNILKISSSPEDLLVDSKSLGIFTDVYIEFINNSNVVCDGHIKYSDQLHNFNLAKNSSYGWILPKGEQVEIGLCGQTRELDLTNL